MPCAVTHLWVPQSRLAVCNDTLEQYFIAAAWFNVKKDIAVSQLSTWQPQSEDLNQTVVDPTPGVFLSPDVFPPQGPDVFSGEQDVGSQSGCGSGPDSVSDSEPGSAQTHQRVHHPSHTVVSGKHVTQYKCI